MSQKQGLYNPANDHDSCGVGFIANLENRKSHKTIRQGLAILNNLAHRGATGAHPLTGDGAGILIQLPDAFLRAEMKKQGISLPPINQYAVGMLLLPRHKDACQICEKTIESVFVEAGLSVLAWRDVPTEQAYLSPNIKNNEPIFKQIFVANRTPSIQSIETFECKLMIVRNQAHRQIQKQFKDDKVGCYFASLSSQTLCYKGMVIPRHFDDYFTDLKCEDLKSALILVHQRFSTNTQPKWELAQPFRMLCHNGEINTIQGNINWMQARRANLSSTLIGPDLVKLWPLIGVGNSDSASFDNVLELLVASGYSLAHAMMMMIPEAWHDNDLMDPQLRAFYEYYAGYMEPWDGPAFIAFTNGRVLGAKLDRNGLRPGRYIITDEGSVVMASEVGVVDIPDANIVAKSRLKPGKIFLIDLEQGCIQQDAEIKRQLASQFPYPQWLAKTRIHLASLTSPTCAKVNESSACVSSLKVRQQAFGYTQETINFFIKPMSLTGEDPIGSMGRDTPPAILSLRPKLLYDYFKQRFAEVTNPAIDPIRESLVMSMASFLGSHPNLLDPQAGQFVKQLILSTPILSHVDRVRIHSLARHPQHLLKPKTLDICFSAKGQGAMAGAVEQVCSQARAAIAQGYNLLILSDKRISQVEMAIPALLAISAVHHDLIRSGLRTHAGLVIETGEACQVHDFCVLAGFGAQAIYPYCALESVAELNPQAQAQTCYIQAATKGMQKVMSKMGISTFQSYCGAQIFDAIGLHQDFIDRFFPGTQSPLGGIGLAEIEFETRQRHQNAFSVRLNDFNPLPPGGELRYAIEGEKHVWTPDSLSLLQHAVRSNDYKKYLIFADQVYQQSRQFMTLRGLLQIKVQTQSIPLDEVEDVSEIIKRFVTGAMSFGSISTEAHSTLAIAMNRLGAKSNSGEGGEDPARNKRLENGDWARSAIKQVASGRFGVTTDYLVNADQIQIKIAQGAKPGEGGQLPGFKVDSMIAKTRHSTPGVGLISPPPHHDIYSIEDLAQLIYDLKNVNPKAQISVKLVSEVGVGTIAAGVTKGFADHILISGYDGGTGASPLTSILHAGLPWEIGLAETQQTLLLNHLRTRVRLQVDGGLRTGRDVIIAALLGADEFCFGTAALITQGCIMMRKCHLNTCPVGVATQDPHLRQRFIGKPEYLINYFQFLAQEIRTWMAKLGIRRFSDLIGRVDLLEAQAAIDHWKANGLTLSPLLFMPGQNEQLVRHHCESQNHPLDGILDDQLIAKAKQAICHQAPLQINIAIRNINRSVGSRLSGYIMEQCGSEGLADNTIYIKATGTAGQSFGAFLVRGVTLELNGEANDYVGKGLSGGRIIIYPPPGCNYDPQTTIIAGNTLLYGATSGEAYINGVVGERFAVRNSGAIAVVEGVGDHGCEYMTGGIVVILGEIGKNFAAGMSGGIIYVLDKRQQLKRKCNKSQLANLAPLNIKGTAKTHTVDLFEDLMNHDVARLKWLIESYWRYTQSSHAGYILNHWDATLPYFIKLMPEEFRQAIQKQNLTRHTT